MTPLKPVNFRLESELMEGLERVKARDGVTVTEQVRRALRQWLEQKGVTPRAASPRRTRSAGRKR